MSERSSFWTGTSVGDAVAAPYDAPNHFSEVLNALAGTRDKSGDYPAASVVSYGGIFPGHLNELKVTVVGSSVSVNTGRALSYGAWYQNDGDGPVVFPISTPSGATRRDRVVLRKDWTTQTVRLVLLTGVEGGGSPAVVRTLGDKYDISLAVISTTTAGVISILFDTRVFLPYRADPLCEIYRATDQTIGTGATITWEFSRFNTYYGISFNAALNPTRLIVPRAGIYRVYGLINISAPSPYTAHLRIVDVFKQPADGSTAQQVFRETRDQKLNDNQTTHHWDFTEQCVEEDYFYVVLGGTLANTLLLASQAHAAGAPQTYPTFGLQWIAHNPTLVGA